MVSGGADCGGCRPLRCERRQTRSGPPEGVVEAMGNSSQPTPRMRFWSATGSAISGHAATSRSWSLVREGAATRIRRSRHVVGPDGLAPKHARSVASGHQPSVRNNRGRGSLLQQDAAQHPLGGPARADVASFMEEDEVADLLPPLPDRTPTVIPAADVDVRSAHPKGLSRVRSTDLASPSAWAVATMSPRASNAVRRSAAISGLS